VQTHELDLLLDAARESLDGRALAATNELVESTRQAVDRGSSVPAWHRRPRVRVGLVLAAAITLTAGASVTAAELSIPPFQTIGAGTERTTTAIPLDYVQTDGKPVRCLAFMEFENLNSAHDTRVEAFIKTHDWTGFGQTIYDRAVARAEGPTEVDQSMDIDAPLYAEARTVFPGLPRSFAVDPATQLSFAGSSMSCTPPGE
jgi:hypothetical protein